MKKDCFLSLFDDIDNGQFPEKYNVISLTTPIASPLNYTGGKFKLLPQILPLFPKQVETFVDLFCGGCNVGCNAAANRVVFNDNNEILIGLLGWFQQTDSESLFNSIESVIQKYELSNSMKYGYEYYNANGSDGLANANREGFQKLRDEFNGLDIRNSYYYLLLYVLIIFSFNNQIRFNRNDKFNLPVGKRDFNSKMRNKLWQFINRIQSIDCQFQCKDFNSINIDELSPQGFVYADPPYLITCATYNEQNGWNEDNERSLLNFLDKLHERKIRFALSNVLKSKGKVNTILNDWINQRKDRYFVEYLNFNYANSNYHTKDKSDSAEEVLIRNYR